MAATTHPSGRVQVVDIPTSLPGKCSLCGSVGGDGRKFIDIGFELDFYGVVYFCTHCVCEIAGAVEYVSPSLFKVVEDENNELADKVTNLEAENVKLRSALSNLDFLGLASVSANVGSDIVERSESKSETKSGPSKSANESGRANVRETQSNDRSKKFADLNDI